MLDFNRALRREAMQRTIKMRGKRNAFIINDSEFAVLARNIFVIYGNCFFLRRIILLRILK